MKRFSLIFVLVLVVYPVSAVMRVSLGYGVQLNSMVSAVLDPALAALVTNAEGRQLVGQSSGTNYQANWRGAIDDNLSTYALVSLPELRLSADWQTKTWTYGVFATAGGFLPQTLYYYTGSYQLSEGRTCAGVDYSNCPLAALSFVAASGRAAYETEVRTNLRAFGTTIGLSLARPGSAFAGGVVTIVYELGLHMQSLAATTQFASVRCSGGGPVPCSQLNQLRVIQGEMTAFAEYAFGPQLGLNVRFEKPQSWWYLEIGAQAIFLFSRIRNAGYTNFVAGGTVAFTQTTQALGIDAAQNFFAVLPALSIRAGIRL